MNEQRLAATLTYRVALSVDEHCGPRLICLVRWFSVPAVQSAANCC